MTLNHFNGNEMEPINNVFNFIIYFSNKEIGSVDFIELILPQNSKEMCGGTKTIVFALFLSQNPI